MSDASSTATTTGETAIATEHARQTPATDTALEEVARRLVRIHAALAVEVGGDRELTTWTRHQVEALLEYVDGALDAEQSASGVKRA